MPEVFVIDGVEAQEPLAKIFSGAITCARSHHAHRELVNTQSCRDPRLHQKIPHKAEKHLLSRQSTEGNKEFSP